MKRIIFLIILVSVSFGQDTLHTRDGIIKGQVVGFDSSHVAMLKEGENQIALVPVKVIEELSLFGGEELITAGLLIVTPAHPLWYPNTRTLYNLEAIPEPILSRERRLNALVVNSKDWRIEKPNIPQVKMPEIKGKFRSGRFGGVLIGVSGAIGLYLLNSEFDGDIVTDYDDFEKWLDTRETLSNIQQGCLLTGGFMIAVSIDF